MKSTKSVLWAGIALAISVSVLAQVRTVATRGVGVAPITRDVDSARRVALMMAQRDAVERAVGAEVRVEAIPSDELTRVVTTTSGKLKYKVTNEDVQPKLVIVEIEAEVEVPADLEAKYPRLLQEETTGYQALVQKTPAGEINWRDGYLTARGVGKLKGGDEKARLEARRAAQLDAYAQALRMISGMNLDGDETVEARLKKAPTAEYTLRGLVQGAEITAERTPEPGSYEVTIKVQLRGLKGLQRAFTEGQRKSDGPPARAAEPEITGLVVDLRGLGAIPSVFPEIVDPDGKVLYNADMVDPAALMERGAAAWVTGAPESTEGKGAWAPGVLRVAALGVYPVLLPRAPWASPWTSLVAQAAPTRVVLRQGPRPTTVSATTASGPNRTRIVVSAAAAGKVRSAQSGALRQGRVVIITDSMIGGTEGRALPVIRLGAAR